MRAEYKFVPLSELKMSDEGNGEISGYRAVYGVIDESGDIIIKGAFRDTLDQYLRSGFSAHSHSWDFVSAIGYPVEAYEDDHGWFVRSEFHSTAEAQTARTIAKERLKAKKTVGFSFGYAATKTHFVEPRAYETELPRYLKASYLTEGLRKAQRFTRIRILKALEAIEDSLVTAPMNKLAMATGAKSLHGDGLPLTRLEHDRARNHALRTLHHLGVHVDYRDLRKQMIDNRLRSLRYV